MDNIAQIHSKLDKMPDAYLTQLVENQDPKATVALMVLGTRQNAAKTMAEEPATTVAQQTVAETRGLPSVAPQQNNQDPRLMAGVGSMPMTPRDSMDTPMNGIAQLPAQQMMADGGIVGFADRGLVDEEGMGFRERLRRQRGIIDRKEPSLTTEEQIRKDKLAAFEDSLSDDKIGQQLGYVRETPATADLSQGQGLTSGMDYGVGRGGYMGSGEINPLTRELLEVTKPIVPAVRKAGEVIGDTSQYIVGGLGRFAKGFGEYILDTPERRLSLEELDPRRIAKQKIKEEKEKQIQDRSDEYDLVDEAKSGTTLRQGDREILRGGAQRKLLEKAEKERVAAKAAAKKAEAERVAAAKKAAEAAKARELAVEKAARKKRQRESGRELLATSAAMLRAAEEGKSTLGVFGAGAEGREAALSRREAAEVAATEAESVQGARSDEILIKQMAAEAALGKVGLDQRKAVLEYLSTDATGMSLTAEADRILEAKEVSTLPEAMDKAVGNVLELLRKQGLISSSIGAAPTTASPQTSLNSTTEQYIQ